VELFISDQRHAYPGHKGGPSTWPPNDTCYASTFLLAQWRQWSIPDVSSEFGRTTPRARERRWRIQALTAVGSNQFWCDERHVEASTYKSTAWITRIVRRRKAVEPVQIQKLVYFDFGAGSCRARTPCTAVLYLYCLCSLHVRTYVNPQRK
jgi:hypothetical protein